MSARMHQDQVDVDEGLVRRLLAEQMPDWAGLPLTPVAEQGTDHALFRLGTELLVRMPVIGWADGQAALEAEWLPRLAPHLPLEVSVPVALGEPGLGYPFRWSVNPWLAGDRLDPASVVAVELARDLAGFVRALRSCDTTGAGRFGSRGVPALRVGRAHSLPPRPRDRRRDLAPGAGPGGGDRPRAGETGSTRRGTAARAAHLDRPECRRDLLPRGITVSTSGCKPQAGGVPC